MGGISKWQDAAEYMTVGADAVQVCTEVMVNGYGIINALKKGLLDYLEEKGMKSPKDLKNKAIANLTAHESLPKKKKSHPAINDEICIKCGECVKICSESEHCSLSLIKGHVKLNEKQCVGCSLCSIVCPQKAIKMK